MTVLQDLRDRAASRPAHIVLSEGHDPRIVAGAVQAVKSGIATITLVGPQDTVTMLLGDADATGLIGISVQDPATSALTAEFAQTYFDLRKHKGVSEDVAALQARDPLVFAAMMVRNGHADGTVGGAVATTSDTVRAALQVIGKAKNAALVSSFFLMALPPNHPSGRGAMVFGDCGLVIDPTSEELAAIAVASAASCQQLLGDAAKVALLSFSTMGSARHSAVTKVSDAVKILHDDIRCRWRVAI
jgi:phosphate acetyltransferase